MIALCIICVGILHNCNYIRIAYYMIYNCVCIVHSHTHTHTHTPHTHTHTHTQHTQTHLHLHLHSHSHIFYMLLMFTLHFHHLFNHHNSINHESSAGLMLCVSFVLSFFLYEYIIEFYCVLMMCL